MKTLNLWPNIRSAQTTQQITINQWCSWIQSSDHKAEIEAARCLGKSHPFYHQLKQQLPAVTFNFQFDGSRRNQNITESTGFLYLDFDCDTQEKAKQIKQRLVRNSFVFATWLSLSQQGVAAIVRVKGITTTNFKQEYLEICKELGLEREIDQMAIKCTQQTVLSYDPEIYINTKSKIKKCKTPNIKKTNSTYIRSFTLLETEFVDAFDSLIWERHLPLDEYTQTVVRNRPEVFFRAYWPFEARGRWRKINQGERNSVFSKLINNLAILNPNKASQVLRVCNWFNQNWTITPYAYAELKSMVDWAYKANLQPVCTSIKSTWIHPKCKNKLKELGKSRQAESKLKIELFLSEWLCTDKKITKRLISQETGLSRPTIDKYIINYEQEINEHNKKCKTPYIVKQQHLY
jgi:hypothetical protein